MSGSNGDYFMKHKLLLSLFLAVTCTLMSWAEGFVKVNIGSLPLQRDIMEGEYTTIECVNIYFQSDYVNCYFTDWSKVIPTINSEAVDVIALKKDENGYAHQLRIPINVLNEEMSSLRVPLNLKYINKDEENPEEKSINSSTTIRFRYTEYSTPESADDFVREGLLRHVDNIKYPYNNPPGEYDALLGDYAIDLNSIYTHFYPNAKNSMYRPYVMNDEGKIIAYCTDCINRNYLANDNEVSFHVSIDKAITEPGTYWIVFVSDGDYRFYDSVGGYHNVRHLARMKVGPYIVKEHPNGELPTSEAQLTEWTAETFESDMLPTEVTGCLENAATLACHKNDASNYSTFVVYGTDSVAVTSLAVSDRNHFTAMLPSKWYKGVGDYKVVVTKPNDIFDALTSDGQRIVFDEEISMPFTVKNPALPESLDFYVKSASGESYEIGEGETVSVRMMHENQALGMKIYVKWTGDEPMQSVMATDANGFAEHTGDVEISSPGRLEYYTTRGGVKSAVKAVSFVAKPTAAIDSPEIISSIPTEEGLYDLRGVRVSGNPQTGIYIRRLSDGTARKVIVR